MKKKQFANEKKYLLSMHFVQAMESQHIITKEEVVQIRKALTDRYKPLNSIINPYIA